LRVFTPFKITKLITTRAWTQTSA